MEVKVNHLYRHYKGDLYLVEAIAKDSNTLQPVVLYRGIYEDCPLWTRDLEEFREVVDKNGQVHRFEEVTIESKRKNPTY